MSTELELGKLHITIAKSNLELFSATTAAFSPLDSRHEESSSLALELHTLKRAWVRRGRGLRLVVKVLVDGKPPPSCDLHILSSTLCNAKLWSQLGLKASPIAVEEDLSKCSGNATVALRLHYTTDIGEQPKDTVHRLCYTIPATDVAPPPGIEVLGLDAVELELNISRKKTRTNKHPRRKEKNKVDDHSVEIPDLEMILQPLLLSKPQESLTLQCTPSDSGYSSLFSTQTSDSDNEMLLTDFEPVVQEEDDMLDCSVISICSRLKAYSNRLLSAELPQTNDLFENLNHVSVDSNSKKRLPSIHDARDEFDQAVIKMDCIMSLVDAVLRLSITEKPRMLQQGIRVERHSVQSQLSNICPALWSPGYLQEISTRAPLLPTVAHALSHSIYNSATSPTLKAKLHELLYYGVDDADGKIDGEEEAFQENKIAPKTRFELMSAMLWQVMQKQLYQCDAARRLKSLTLGVVATNELGEDDEELFPQTSAQLKDRAFHDFMFEDDEEDLMDYENLDHDLDDEILFEPKDCLEDDMNGDEEIVELSEDDLLLQDLAA